MMIGIRGLALGVLLFLGTASFVQATESSDRALASGADAIPELSRPVMDEAGFLPAAEVSPIEQRILELNRARQIQFAVFIPKSLRGLDIESFSIRVAEKWKLGEASTDRGLLLVLAPAERKMRLEVGYGLEGELTDLWSKRALDEILRPAMRASQPSSGIRDLISEIDRKLGLSAEASQDEERRLAKNHRNTGSSGDFHWFYLIFLGFWLLNVVRSIRGRRRGMLGRSGYATGGSILDSSTDWSSGGSDFSGGGGDFGGGGASSDW